MSRFSETHKITVIRGKRRPGKSKVIKELLNRASWLEKKYERTRREGSETPDRNPFVRELRAVAQAIELLEQEDDGPTVRTITEAINESCTCGGAGPGEGCPACEVWHWLFTSEG